MAKKAKYLAVFDDHPAPDFSDPLATWNWVTVVAATVAALDAMGGGPAYWREAVRSTCQALSRSLQAHVIAAAAGEYRELPDDLTRPPADPEALAWWAVVRTAHGLDDLLRGRVKGRAGCERWAAQRKHLRTVVETASPEGRLDARDALQARARRVKASALDAPLTALTDEQAAGEWLSDARQR